MKDVVLVGAGKFALEVARYIDDVTAGGADAYRITRYLALNGEPRHAPDELTLPLEEFDPTPGARVVVAVSDTAQRRALLDGFIADHDLTPESIVHPSASLAETCRHGVGNIVGPNCYVGVNVTIGDFNVVNYHCTVGHHTRIGSNNFIAPNFHCGNSVTVGDNNFFGLSCTLAPDVAVGDDCTFQAGLNIFDPARSGHSYFSPSRLKAIQSL
jgi:UDP-3-O-[3-hydroxymyristoyl] glucosamine N-acyltransferase